jgi:hypothetical protein
MDTSTMIPDIFLPFQKRQKTIKLHKDLDRLSFLINEIRSDLNEGMSSLQELKGERIWDIRPISKQGELFFYLPEQPEQNEKIFRLCLGALVETL